MNKNKRQAISPAKRLSSRAIFLTVTLASVLGFVIFKSFAAGSDITVSGNHLLKGGQPFYPVGFNMQALVLPSGCSNALPSAARDHYGAAELVAARDTWHANTLRFQISQPGFDPQDTVHSTPAYIQRVRDGVALARQYGFTVILSMQDQGPACGTTDPLPSAQTMRAWQTAAPLFSSDKGIMFELFNEPHPGTGASLTNIDDAGWAQYRNGGVGEAPNNFDAVGHQQLLDAIRATGAHNVILAGHAQNLDTRMLLSDPTGQLAYSVHPYYFQYSSGATESTNTTNLWAPRYGNFTNGVSATVPVIATEWNFDKTGSCTAGAEAMAPKFFAYLKSHSIGVLGHAFDVQTTIVSDWSYTPRPVVCDNVNASGGVPLKAFFDSLVAPVTPPSTGGGGSGGSTTGTTGTKTSGTTSTTTATTKATTGTSANTGDAPATTPIATPAAESLPAQTAKTFVAQLSHPSTVLGMMAYSITGIGLAIMSIGGYLIYSSRHKLKFALTSIGARLRNGTKK